MRQRNDTNYVVNVSAWPTDDDPTRQPFRVGPQEIIDFPSLLGGFTEVLDEPVPDTPKSKRKDAAAVAAVPEEGEPQ